LSIKLGTTMPSRPTGEWEASIMRGWAGGWVSAEFSTVRQFRGSTSTLHLATSSVPEKVPPSTERESFFAQPLDSAAASCVACFQVSSSNRLFRFFHLRLFLILFFSQISLPPDLHMHSLADYILLLTHPPLTTFKLLSVVPTWHSLPLSSSPLHLPVLLLIPPPQGLPLAPPVGTTTCATLNRPTFVDHIYLSFR